MTDFQPTPQTPEQRDAFIQAKESGIFDWSGWCVYAWVNYMWMHLEGFTDEDLMRRSFWYYLNYGMTGNEMDLQE